MKHYCNPIIVRCSSHHFLLFVVAENAVAEFPFDKCTSGSDIADSNLSAILSNVEYTTNVNGQPDSAIQIKKSSDSWIEIPISQKLDTKYSLSLVFNVYLENQYERGIILNYGSANSGLNIFTANNFIIVKLLERGAPFKNALQTPVSASTHKWIRLAMVYDYNTNSGFVSVDGNIITLSVPENAIQIATNANIRLGANVFDAPNIRRMRLSCLKFYNRALTEKEVNDVTCRTGKLDKFVT